MRNLVPCFVLAVMMTAAIGERAQAQFQIEPAFPNLSFASPVDLQNPGDGTNRLFVVERAGVIRVFENDPAVATAPIFLDIQGRVSSGGERGLLGLAFDPDFASNGYFYVYYTAPSPLHSVVSRFEVEVANPRHRDSLRDFGFWILDWEKFDSLSTNEEAAPVGLGAASSFVE